MGLIPSLVSFSPSTTILSNAVNANLAAIRTAFNNTAVLTDVARTIAVTHTFTPSQTFTGGATFGAAINGTTAAFSGAATAASAAIAGALTSATAVIGGDPGGAEPLRVTGGFRASGTISTTGDIDMLAAVGNRTLAIRRPAGSVGYLDFRTVGVTRWSVLVNGAAEAGANAGSDFRIDAYTDAGAYLRTNLEIVRATGNARFAADLIAGAGVIAEGGALRSAVVGDAVVLNNSRTASGTSVVWSASSAPNDARISSANNGSLTASGAFIAGADPGGTELVRAASGRFTAIVGTLSTAAQPNVTSVGQLAGLTVAGALVPEATNTRDIGTNLARWQNVYLNNLLSIGGIATLTTSTLSLSGSTTGRIILGQTVNQPGIRFIDATSTLELILGTGGNLAISSVATFTSATAGGASALPATPAGYMLVTIAGTDRRIPFYA